MSEFIRSLDPTQRAFIVIVFAVAVKGLLASAYSRWKAAQKNKPVTLRLADGIYIQDGKVERIERAFSVLSTAWGVLILFLLAALIWQRLG